MPSKPGPIDKGRAKGFTCDKSGLSFTELKNPCRCCGLGGGLGYTNYKLSMEIARDKAANIVDSKADIVATACPGCMIQIKDGLNLLGAKTKVKHVVELTRFNFFVSAFERSIFLLRD